VRTLHARAAEPYLYLSAGEGTAGRERHSIYGNTCTSSSVHWLSITLLIIIGRPGGALVA